MPLLYLLTSDIAPSSENRTQIEDKYGELSKLGNK